MANIGKVSTAAALSRETRRALGGLTQKAFAAHLLVSRNYISQIEAGLKTPSPRLQAQMKQMLTKSAPTDPVSTPPLRELAVEEPPPPQQHSGASNLNDEVRQIFEELFSAAENDHHRLCWLRVELDQLRTFARTWLSNDDINRRVIARRLLDADHARSSGKIA